MIAGGPKPPLSSLAPVLGSNIADAAKVSGWNKQGILVVAKNDKRLTTEERKLVRQLGEKLYGQQHGKEVPHG